MYTRLRMTPHWLRNTYLYGTMRQHTPNMFNVQCVYGLSKMVNVCANVSIGFWFRYFSFTNVVVVVTRHTTKQRDILLQCLCSFLRFASISTKPKNKTFDFYAAHKCWRFKSLVWRYPFVNYYIYIESIILALFLNMDMILNSIIVPCLCNLLTYVEIVERVDTHTMSATRIGMERDKM